MIYAYHSASYTCLHVPSSVEKNDLSDGYVQLTDVEYETYFAQPTPENKRLVSDVNGRPSFVDYAISFEEQVIQVYETRRSLYTNVDALRNEAQMIRMVENDEAKATDYETQAADLYLKIRNEHPWPIE